MRKYIGNLAAIAVAVGLTTGAAATAAAHAVIVSASPTADQHVASGKLAVRIDRVCRLVSAEYQCVRQFVRIDVDAGLDLA